MLVEVTKLVRDLCMPPPLLPLGEGGFIHNFINLNNGNTTALGYFSFIFNLSATAR